MKCGCRLQTFQRLILSSFCDVSRIVPELRRNRARTCFKPKIKRTWPLNPIRKS